MWKRLAILICGVCLLMICTADAASAHSRATEPDARQQNRQCALWHDDGHHGEAMISDSDQLLRICSTRPVRTVQSFIKTRRPLANAIAAVMMFNKQSRQSGEVSSPVIAMPHSRYYVFRLRRLLC